MSPRHFKVENTMDFEIEMELHFYFKSHCDSREKTHDPLRGLYYLIAFVMKDQRK